MREREGGWRKCKGRGRAEQKELKKEREKDAGSEAAETERVKDGVGQVRQDFAGDSTHNWVIEEEEEEAEMSATRVRTTPEAETDFIMWFHFLYLLQIWDPKSL